MPVHRDGGGRCKGKGKGMKTRHVLATWKIEIIIIIIIKMEIIRMNHSPLILY